MAGWYQQLNGHECEQTPGDSEAQGSLACCSPQSRRVGHSLANEQQQKQRPLHLQSQDGQGCKKKKKKPLSKKKRREEGPRLLL